MPGWELIPHPSGPWLLRIGTRLYEVPPDRVADLRADGPPPSLLTRPARRSRRATLWLRIPLLSAARVRRLAERLHPVTRWPVLTGLMALGGAGLAVPAIGAGFHLPALSPPGWAATLVLFGATALWHELGHAAALRRGGYPPGGIGGGLLFVIPVLYADVSAVSALPRRDRLRVDVAGVCFQLGAAGVLALIGAGAGFGPCLWAAALALGAVVWSAIPFLRTDGYWVLCDLLGVRDLDASRGVVFTVYRALNLVFMAAVGGLLLVRLARWTAGPMGGLPELRSGLLAAAVAVLTWRLLAGARGRRGDNA